MAELIQSAYPIFTDIDGTPLDDGFIFIGVAGADPLISPQQAYWDEDLTVPADNIRTKAGYPTNGTFPGRLFTSTNYSILVQNKREITVYAAQDSFVPPAAAGTNLTWTAGTTLGPVVNSSTGTGEAIPVASATASGAVTTDAQTFAGVKTFGNIPILPASNPTLDDEAVRKKYMEDALYPIGITYTQFPGDSDPATLGLPGTWANVSSELAGDFIRFEGGSALAFNAGQQGDAMQKITGSTDSTYPIALRSTGNPDGLGNGALRMGNSLQNVTAINGGATNYSTDLLFDNSLSISPNTAKTDDVETRSVNRTVRKWRRTA